MDSIWIMVAAVVVGAYLLIGVVYVAAQTRKRKMDDPNYNLTWLDKIVVTIIFVVLWLPFAFANRRRDKAAARS